MNRQAAAPAAEEDFSLVLGGPLYQMYLRSGLVTSNVARAERRIAAFIIVAWLPLLVLTLAGGTAFGGVTVPFLADIDVHIRFLVALPLLIGAEVLVHRRIRVTISQFVERGIIVPEDRMRFEEIMASTMRLRNSAAIEIALIVAALTFGHVIWRESMSLHVGTWYAGSGPAGGDQLTVAGWWYAFVSLNLFRFVLLRWYFRLIIWYVFLWRVARMPLRLNPLHPDRAGGLGFISNSVFAFTPVLLAHTTVFAGAIFGQIWHEGMKLPAFQVEIFLTIVLLIAMVVAPLTFFVVHLAGAKRAASREYGLLAMEYVDEFRAKWMRGSRPEGEPLVGSADFQSLADLAGGNDVVKEMRVFPFSRQTVVTLAIVTAIPYLPLTLTMIPFAELVSRGLGKLL